MQVQVVDVPGHQRLRLSLLAHLVGATGIAFVLDATAGAKSIKQASVRD
jgi:signal recognition particle receptor subunit beta